MPGINIDQYGQKDCSLLKTRNGDARNTTRLCATCSNLLIFLAFSRILRSPRRRGETVVWSRSGLNRPRLVSPRFPAPAARPAYPTPERA